MALIQSLDLKVRGREAYYVPPYISVCWWPCMGSMMRCQGPAQILAVGKRGEVQAEKDWLVANSAALRTCISGGTRLAIISTRIFHPSAALLSHRLIVCLSGRRFCKPPNHDPFLGRDISSCRVAQLPGKVLCASTSRHDCDRMSGISTERKGKKRKPKRTAGARISDFFLGQLVESSQSSRVEVFLNDFQVLHTGMRS